jgi:hypothetical protein
LQAPKQKGTHAQSPNTVPRLPINKRARRGPRPLNRAPGPIKKPPPPPPPPRAAWTRGPARPPACFPRAISYRSEESPINSHARPWALSLSLCSTPQPNPPTSPTGGRGAMEAAGNDRREAALGALSVLPDEVLCAVVDILSPADIGRLACVSRCATPARPPAPLPFASSSALLPSLRLAPSLLASTTSSSQESRIMSPRPSPGTWVPCLSSIY